MKRRMLALAFVAQLSFSIESIAASDVLADFPVGPGPFPAVVLAPGQGYPMDLPAMRQSAVALVERGFAVYRFNWSYWNREPKGSPSDDLSAEVQDLQRVIAAARADRRVDAKRVAVGGKSLGSRVAWQVFRADASLTSAMLLTPVCSRRAEGGGIQSVVSANYAYLDTETRPIFFALGDRDPLCEPKVLFHHAALARGPVRISVVSGDHGFNSIASDSASLERNVHMAAEAAAEFAAQIDAPGR